MSLWKGIIANLIWKWNCNYGNRAKREIPGLRKFVPGYVQSSFAPMGTCGIVKSFFEAPERTVSFIQDGYFGRYEASVLYYTNGTMDYRVNDNGEESIGELVIGNVAELWELDSFVDYLKGLEDADFLMMNDCFYYVGASEYSSMLPDELCIVIGNGSMRVTFLCGEEFIELHVLVGKI